MDKTTSRLGADLRTPFFGWDPGAPLFEVVQGNAKAMCGDLAIEGIWPDHYLIPKYTGLRLDLDRYLTYYNTDRAHTGRWTKGRTPEEVIGKVKMWSRWGRCVARTR